eukprot:1385568-Prymnesium_polylepis.1
MPAAASPAITAPGGAAALPDVSAGVGAQTGQSQSPSGTAESGGWRQSVWYDRSQPSPSHSSSQLPSIQVPFPQIEQSSVSSDSSAT